MTPRHQVSRAAIELIKRFEGYRRKAAQLPDGRWTIGYGHTLTAREGAEVSADDAEALLLYDMIGVAHTVSELTFASLTRNQFDALCAFAYSIGLDAFRTSDVLKRVNEGAFTQAAFALELWRRVEFEGERIVVDALVRRRAAEKLLFLTPPGDKWRAVPSAVLRPLLDEAAESTAPRGAPVQVTAALEGERAAVTRDAPALETESPLAAAAEALTARLQALFPDPEAAPAPQPEPEPEPEPAPAEPEPEVEAKVEVEAAPEPEPPAIEPAIEEEPVAAPATEASPAAAAPAEPPPSTPRIVIDDTAPFEFVPAAVQPLDPEAGEGLLAIVCLIVVGLAFFAGGVFWALNARPGPQPTVFTPLLVGWLAGVAGVGFLAAALFMLLQRVTRAAERRDVRAR